MRGEAAETVEGAMISYRWFRAQEIDNATVPSRPPELQALLSRALKESRNWRSDDPVILVAIDGERPAGHVKFTYGHIARLGTKMRAAAAQDLFTHPDYRGQGIGSALISKSLEIGMPCLYSGISGQAMPLYKKLGFSFIDCAPVDQLPLTLLAYLREWRTWLYRVENDADRREKRALRALQKTLRCGRNLRMRAGTEWTALDPTQSCEELRSLAKIHSRMFQVPWSIDLLSSALKGEAPHLHAAVFAKNGPAGRVRHLVTIYRQRASVRIPMTQRHADLADGHLNEIYPPAADVESALGVLRAAARYGKNIGLDNLSVHAMTDELRSACEQIGLASSAAKSVAIQPLGMPDALAAEMVRPENWWCRMANEEQLEEAAA